MATLDPQKVSELKAFVTMCQKNPSLIHQPELSFFKEYLQSLHADIPPKKSGEGLAEEASTAGEANEKAFFPSEEEDVSESEQSEPEPPFDEASLNDSEVIAPETEAPPALAPAGEKELTDEEQTKLGKLKEEAAAACESGDYDSALTKYTDALLLGNPTALLYTRRADVLLKLKRLVACIRDCDEALKLNPDNARAYKTRGKANRFLGKWREAHHDIDVGQKLDYDDGLWDMQKFVDEKYKIIEEHDRRVERKREEQQRKAREKEAKRRRDAARKAYEEQKKREASGGGFPGGFPGGAMPGGFPGAGAGGFNFPGGMPGGFPGGVFNPGTGAAGADGGCCGGDSCGMPRAAGSPGAGGFGSMPGGAGGLGNLLGAFNDPNMKKIFENPKMMAAFQDIMSNPSSISKYANDPEVMAALGSLTSKFGGGAMPGGAGGFPK